MAHSASLAATLCAALAGALWLTSWAPAAQQHASPRRHRVAVFFEPGFPAVDIQRPDERLLREALSGVEATFLDAGQLVSTLRADRFDTLVMPFGGAFPEQAWPAILAFLGDGGGWVQVGGKPFSVPVARAGDRWQPSPETTACYKALGFTHIFEVPASAVVSWTRPGGGTAPSGGEPGFRADAVYAADVRLTNSKDFPDEDGSDGPREGRVQPLVVGLDDAGRPAAAPIVRIDRLAGAFAGGAWLLAPVRGQIDPATVRWLVDEAAGGGAELWARPAFAGFLPGEDPVVEIGLRWPRAGSTPLSVPATVLVLAPGGSPLLSTTVTLEGAGGVATAKVTVPTSGRALDRGLYQVRASVAIDVPGAAAGMRLQAGTGFWSYDLSMLRGGIPLTATKDGFTRRGRPFTVLGTTYMASDVHRRFLLEPNPQLWRDDFAAMKAAGVNLVRTGLWTGWKVYMPEAGRVHEGALRAFDVFLLTARQHDVPVVLNLFAFLPETWGGENPYLDPRAVSAQQAFVGALAARYAHADDLVWDLINEPSFSAAAHLWKTRPNGDASERAAWDTWLRARYGGGADYAAAVRRAWVAAPDEALSLPSPDDFLDRNLFGALRPLKAADYKRFSQDQFTDWVGRMTSAIRANGNRGQLVTVGQDEGGLSERPNPLLFGRAVDFTCMHTWWYNDALAWDAVLARLPDRPMLVEETGMMRYERIDGAAWRTERDAAALLERKLAMAVGAGSAGYVQWIWNTNPYMASDNEAGIGFLRADGTARPELAAFIEISRFLAEHAEHFHGREPEDVVVLVPQSQMFSARNHAVESTQRAVRVLTNHLHIVPRAVNELNAGTTLGAPRLVIAPAPRVLTAEAWQALLKAADAGATILVTGAIDSDENWRHADRTGAFGLRVSERPVASEEALNIDGRTYRLGYRGDKLERVQVPEVAGHPLPEVHRATRGRGAVLWAPMPVELSDSPEATAALYRMAATQAGVTPRVTIEPQDPAVFAGSAAFTDTLLVSLTSETSRDLDLSVSVPGMTGHRVRLPAGRAAMLLLERKTGRLLGRTGR